MKTGLVCAVAVALLSSPALAEDYGDDTDIELGGYFQPGFIAVANSDFNEDDHEGFELANARITGAARRTLIPDLDAGLSFNFDVNQGNFAVKDAYVTLGWRDELVAIDVGQLKTPFSLALMQSESQLQFPFSPRIRVLSFDRDLGARLRGRYIAPKGIGIDWWAMVANGEGGFRQRRNIDNEFLFTGRLEVTPLGSMDRSVPDLFDSELRVAVAANAGYTPSLGSGLGLDDVGAKELRLGGDLRVHWRGLSVRGEYIWADRGDNGVASPGFRRYGLHAQVGYVLPLSYFGIQLEPAFRFEQLDLDDNLEGDETGAPVIEESEVRLYEAGFNVYLAGHSAKLQIAYRREDLLEGFVDEPDPDGGTRPLIGDSLLTFIQVGWL